MSLGFHPQYYPCVVINNLHLAFVLCLGTLTMAHILLRSSLRSLESPAGMNLLVLKTMQSSFSCSAFSGKHSHTSERNRVYQGSNEITQMKNKIEKILRDNYCPIMGFQKNFTTNVTLAK